MNRKLVSATHNFASHFSPLKTRIVVALMCGLFSVCMAASEAYAEKENVSSFWFMSLTRLKFDHNIRAFVDIQPRTALDSAAPGADGDVRQLLLRGALGYEFSPGFTLFLGYANISVYGPKRMEDRLFQEFLGKTPIGNWGLLHRVRFEQRAIEGVSGTSLRGRYFLRLTRPFDFHPDFSLAINEEVFVNLNSKDGGPQTGFDQNRLFLGLNYKINENLGFDFGYQNQYVERRGGAVDPINHIIFLGLLTNFDLQS